jgi:hypothetical protein
MANFTPGFGKGMGEGDTDIVPLRASDIRPTSSISNTVQPPSAAPLVARTNQLGTPALERIRADEMDPRIQRQKARIAAAEAERKKAYAKSVTQHPSNWVPRLY